MYLDSLSEVKNGIVQGWGGVYRSYRAREAWQEVTHKLLLSLKLEKLIIKVMSCSWLHLRSVNRGAYMGSSLGEKGGTSQEKPVGYDTKSNRSLGERWVK